MRWLCGLFAAAVLALAAPALAAPKHIPQVTYPFSDQGEFWINSDPLNDRDLHGKPVLVFFWTYGCYNCANTMEWINSVQARYGDDGLLILGVHSPEFPHEKNKKNVRDKTAEYGIEFPVMIDNDFSFWKSMQNSWWPAVHLYDGTGEHQGTYVGEIHLDTSKASEVEGLITRLINESG